MLQFFLVTSIYIMYKSFPACFHVYERNLLHIYLTIRKRTKPKPKPKLFGKFGTKPKPNSNSLTKPKPKPKLFGPNSPNPNCLGLVHAYTRPTFIFRVINQICRSGSIPLMLKIRFFLNDLFKQYA